MKTKIIILEDDERRAIAMRICLQNQFHMYEVCIIDSAGEMNCFLEKHLNEAVVIALDHDLEVYRDKEGELHDAGTGREVADHIAKNEPVCSIIIHSTNLPAAIGMEMVLNENGWTTHRISTYADLEWIDELWFPTIKQAIDKVTE